MIDTCPFDHTKNLRQALDAQTERVKLSREAVDRSVNTILAMAALMAEWKREQVKK